MYKVVLVDDEPWALNGVQKTFKWDEFSFEVIAATTDPTEAQKIIAEKIPDVIFTDIRMPGMSGIELMQAIREKELDTEFIIISGFSDFSYAQEAIRQGAFDYCLKPIEYEYADELLKRLKSHLQQKKGSSDIELFEAISEGHKNLSDLLKYKGLIGYEKYYQAVVVLSESSNCENSTLNFPQDLSKIKITLGFNKTLYILNTNSDVENIIGSHNVHCNIGISTISESIDDIFSLYYEADKAARSNFIYGENGIFHYAKKNIPILKQQLKSFYTDIEEKNHGIKNLTDGLTNFFRTEKLSTEDLVFFWNCIVANLFQTFGEDSYDIGFDFMDYEQLMSQFISIEAFSEFIFNGVNLLFEGVNEDEPVTESMNIEFYRLLSYIQEHYNEQLYLRDITKAFFLSSNYCCRLFKKYTGSTFSNYINNIRIEKAKEFLKNSQLSIEEVTQEVGYNDYYYFNKLFKKYVGITPAKFRNKIENN